MKSAPGILAGMLVSVALAVPARPATLVGTLVYQKIPAAPQGLDPAHAVLAPATQTHIQILSSDGTKTLADGSTDVTGHYQIIVPDGSGMVVFSARSEDEIINVGGQPDKVYVVSTPPLDPAHWPTQITIPDTNSLSGPFNILATIHRANQMLLQIEPGLPLSEHPIAIVWNQGAAPGAFYDFSNQVISLNGKPDVDTDEFDDSVILQLYGYYLIHQFSRDDSPGGPASFGEQLDPRLAWEDGWSHFFAQAVLGNSIYVDTQGAGGKDTFALDLEPDQLQGEKPGYWSAFSVASALWDLFADKSSGADHAGLGLAPIWKVLRGYFPDQVFVSLLTLADGLVQTDPAATDGLVGVLANHGIDYHPGVIPPVALPFPQPIPSGQPVTGTIDSATTKRTNLLSSADYYILHKSTNQALSIDITITAAPEADGGTLSLQIFDSTGAPIGSNIEMQGLGNDSQVSMTLPAGTYVIGVMSYIPSRSGVTFGSAQYRLTATY